MSGYILPPDYFLSSLYVAISVFHV